ncbi:lipid-A-disaccharide kinase [Cohaesibacter sp. ES.047]|uniref:tetraacyldisaccharide 4'-kinase n=1 Tax=Cohaesibacter sp. ES.047 TaxID=1798205 RepID=UPI000BB80795|nr:tetraacyldisaccharide 4'-kinase [Cohaesibacter sp. ES.047]SNY92129.1 lipid-A-disaccharide kinase [Cohaesibacter sp. ES.047]
MKAPGFWKERGMLAWLLYPVSFLYGRISLSRFNKPARYKAHLPVLCVGNLVAGGAGKTPMVIAIGAAARAIGLSPIFLTRGYGGTEGGPLKVDPKTHRVRDVGDEALLLARIGPTIVARDRVGGAKLAEDVASSGDGGGIIIMDDGFQNPYLYKDLTLVAVDAQQSIGNGFVLPAGPLRAPLLPQVRRADQFIVIGEGERAPRLRQLAAKLGKASNHASLRPGKCNLLGGTHVLAFCGIGRPEKFYHTLDELELERVDQMEFADHHPYTEAEAEAILKRAKDQNLSIVTTAKDHVRLVGLGKAGDKLARKAHVVEVNMVFDDRAFPRRAIEQAQRKFSRR